MKKIFLVISMFVMTTIALSKTTLNISIPINKEYLSIENKNLDIIGFSVEVDKEVFKYKESSEFGLGFGVEKLPSLNVDIEKEGKVKGGDATLLPLFIYGQYNISDNFYFKSKIGYTFKLDSSDIKVKIEDIEYEYKNDLKGGVFLKNEIGYIFYEKRLFLFHKFIGVESNIGKNYSAFGIGFGLNF